MDIFAEELQYVKDMMTRNDIENSKREACARAKAEGKTEGAEQKQREVAKNMKTKDIGPDIIAECTGLSLEDIQAL